MFQYYLEKDDFNLCFAVIHCLFAAITITRTQETGPVVIRCLFSIHLMIDVLSLFEYDSEFVLSECFEQLEVH